MGEGTGVNFADVLSEDNKQLVTQEYMRLHKAASKDQILVVLKTN